MFLLCFEISVSHISTKHTIFFAVILSEYWMSIRREPRVDNLFTAVSFSILSLSFPWWVKMLSLVHLSSLMLNFQLCHSLLEPWFNVQSCLSVYHKSQRKMQTDEIPHEWKKETWGRLLTQGESSTHGPVRTEQKICSSKMLTVPWLCTSALGKLEI